MQLSINCPFEYKADGAQITGHGSVFGNIDQGGDIVLEGAFKRSLAQHRRAGTSPAMLWQHDSSQVPGVWTQAGEDDTGLALKGEFADTQLGQEVRTLTKMRAVNGLSIGVVLKDFDFDNDGNRLIKEADLWEISIVTFPMNPKAVIEAVKTSFTPRTYERYLRDAGATAREAKTVVSELFNGTLDDSHRDGDSDPDLAAFGSLFADETNAINVYEMSKRLWK